MQKKGNDTEVPEDADGRREFLKSCGRFATVTPPAITMLLSTSLTSNAIASSGGDKGRGTGRSGGGGDRGRVKIGGD